VYLWRPLDVCSWLVYFGDGMFVGGMGIKTIDIKLIRLYTVKTVQTNILSISMHIYKCLCICKT
jgi:hypothetical protein